jgi:hypothetical protein
MKNYNSDNRHRITFHVVFETLSPLSHIGEAVGNQSNLKTLTITDIEGQPNQVFCLSGNSIRNRILRRVGIDGFLERLGHQVSPILHHALFCGGALDGGTANNLELDKKIREYLVPISLLGTAKPKGLFNSKDAQMIPGRINVGNAMLVCYESALNIYNTFAPAIPLDAIPGLKEIEQARRDLEEARVNQFLQGTQNNIDDSEYQEKLKYWLPFLQEKLRPYSHWLTYNQKTRRDSHHDPNLVKYLLPAPVKVGQQSLFGDVTDSKPEKEEKQKSNQMIMGSWLIQAGAKLYSRWNAFVTDVEEGYIADALLKWSSSPYVGGQANTGCGQVAVNIYYSSEGQSGNWMFVNNGTQALGERAAEKHERYNDYLAEYEQYLKDNVDDVVGLLG